jgi:hypothetical protein
MTCRLIARPRTALPMTWSAQMLAFLWLTNGGSIAEPVTFSDPTLGY